MIVRHVDKKRFELPLEARHLSEFLEGLPVDAVIRVTVHEGGSQRDPYPVAYTLIGEWEK